MNAAQTTALLDTDDAADKVLNTYYALRAADEAERIAEQQLLQGARHYAQYVQGRWNADAAEELLIDLGDAAIEHHRRLTCLEERQQEMKQLWRSVPVRFSRR